MVKIRFFAGLLFVAFIFFSCDQPTDSNKDDSDDGTETAEGSTVTVLGNAHSSITGTDFGGSETPTVKEVSLVYVNPISDFSVPSEAIAVKRSYDNGFFLIFEVSNVGETPYSFVEIENIFYYNSSGMKLNASSDFTFARGNVGEILTGFTDTCLFPGQTGLVLLFEDFYDDLAYIEYEVSPSSSTPTEVETSLLGETYNYDGDSLSVTIRNNGDDRIDVETGFLFYALRNDAEYAVDWGFFDSSTFLPSNGTLNPNEVGSVAESYWNDDYSVNAVELCLDFAVFDETANVVPRLQDVSDSGQDIQPLDRYTIERNRNLNIKRSLVLLSGRL